MQFYSSELRISTYQSAFRYSGESSNYEWLVGGYSVMNMFIRQ